MPEDPSNRTSDRTESGERSATRMAHGSPPAPDVAGLEAEQGQEYETEDDERRGVELITGDDDVADAQERDDASGRCRTTDPGGPVIAARLTVIAHGCDGRRGATAR